MGINGRCFPNNRKKCLLSGKKQFVEILANSFKTNALCHSSKNVLHPESSKMFQFYLFGNTLGPKLLTRKILAIPLQSKTFLSNLKT
jgi:hypothetical protein